MPDVIIIARLELLHNELSVKQNETTEYYQAKVQLELSSQQQQQNKAFNNSALISYASESVFNTKYL